MALKTMFRDLVVLQHLPKRGVRLWSVVRIGVHLLLFKEVGDRVSLRTGTGTSNQFGVPKRFSYLAVSTQAHELTDNLLG